MPTHHNYFFQVLRGLLVFFVIGTWLMPGRAVAGSYDDFFKAVTVDDHSTVKRLLEQGFDPNTTGPSGKLGLHMAMMDRSFRVAQVLIDAPGTQWDKPNISGETPLMLAALRGHLPLVKTLIAKGAEINPDGWTPLHYAASGDAEKGPEIVRFLLAQGAKTDIPSPSGTTALMLATLYGPEEVISLLLKAKADPTLKNNTGRTALSLAEGIKREGAKKLLLNAMATWQSPSTAEDSVLEFLRQTANKSSPSGSASPSPVTIK